jgi:serine-type D-Ala-D-Ala endopeptidase (penicillin-binding protein 7)
MKKALLLLLVSAGLAVGPTFGPALGEAQAAPRKKAVVVKKQKHVKVRAKSEAKATVKAKHKKHAELSPRLEEAGNLVLQSASAVVVDQTSGAVLFEKNPSTQVPIASITKLMTAMVALDAKPSLSEELTIGDEDVDTLKGTRSRLKVGTQLTREEMLRLALMASENRAAAALSRHYPGGRTAFVAAMNRKAKELGLTDTSFEDSTGLTAANVSSARDLTKMVAAAHRYPLIRQYSTTAEYDVNIAGRTQSFHNTNSLVKNDSWDIGLSKTGYINEAGKCLVMQAWLNNKPMIIVLLDSWGKLTRIGDANRIKRWVESAALAQAHAAG